MSKKILVVEDTADLLDNIIDVLQSEGFAVLSASNGDEALERLSLELPALIITDIMMPGINGFELITKVRKNTRWQHIPILVFTAVPPEGNMEKAFELGASAYLTKPSTLDALVNTVNKLV